MQAWHTKKRRLLDSDDEELKLARRNKKRSRPISSELPPATEPETVRDDEICAQLITSTKAGRKEAALISIQKPVTIGRNAAQCTYVIPDIFVSNVHLKVYAFRTSSGAVLLSCTDSSTNGTMLNDHRIKKTSVILMHGDTLKIPSSQTFKCVYKTSAMRTEKKTIFDPTPLLIPADKVIGKYRVTPCILGSGTFATVNLAYITTGPKSASLYKQVACKMLKVTGDLEKRKLMKEVELLKGLNHPNINHILDVVVNNGFLNIILDLSTGGDLFTYISSRSSGRLNEGEAKYCSFQLMLGLRYLHERNVSHRDLKPENILLHSPGPFPRLIIADFGLARSRAHEHTLNAVGTISYMAPEAILALTSKHCGYVGIYADAWGLGLVLFTMLCGYHPFDRETDVTNDNLDPFKISTSNHSQAIVMSRIIESPVSFQNSLWDNLPDARDLIGQLLIHNPKHRETVKGALASRWISTELDDLKEGYRDRIGSCS